MHKFQKVLLKRLVKDNGLKFSKLTKGYSFEDNIVFHLKQLLKNKLVQKHGDRYFLTSQGLMDSGQFDLETLEEKRYKSLFIGFVIRVGQSYMLREHKGGDQKFYRLPGGKPYLGEKLEDACRRLLKREIAFKKQIPQFRYDSTHYKIQYTSKGSVLFDNILAVYVVTGVGTDLEKINIRNKNRWFKRTEVEKLKNKWPEIDICILKKDWKPVSEYQLICDYNLYQDDLV